MNANSISRSWAALCPPAQIYSIVMAALVLFNLYRGTYRYAVSHGVSLLIGTTFLWVLCAANLQFAAYALLLLPVLFFVFLLALIFYDQSFFQISRSYSPQCVPDCSTDQSCDCETDAALGASK
jgi:hypothetical protein